MNDTPRPIQSFIRAHVQRDTGSFTATPFLPSSCNARSLIKGDTGTRAGHSTQVLSQTAQKWWLPAGFVVPKRQKRTGHRSPEVQTRVLETLRLTLLTKLFGCFTT